MSGDSRADGRGPRRTAGVAIRPEAAVDAAVIAAVTRAAFAGAPHASGAEAAIIEGLRAAGALALSLVAADPEAAVVGHVAFSPVSIGEGAGGGWYGLGPLSVAPSHQSRGIGSALVADGLARLRAARAAGCVLVGDPGFYARFGFETDPALTYGDVPSLYVQRLVFVPPAPTGAIRYHEAFAAAA